MKIYQTITSRKAGIWHFHASTHNHPEGCQCGKCDSRGGEIQARHAICGSGSHYFKGYHGNKPFTPCPLVDFDAGIHQRNMCPACVEQAYKSGSLIISEP